MFGRVQRDDRGAAAVEFALVSVLLFTLLFGIIQYGFLFFQYQAAAATAHDAARTLAAGPTASVFVSGIGQDGCPPWRDSVIATGTANGLPTGSITALKALTEPPTDPIARGTTVKVVLTFQPTTFGAAFVPMPSSIDVTAVSTIEAVHAVTYPCDL
jgi:hypothetical protein